MPKTIGTVSNFYSETSWVKSSTKKVVLVLFLPPPHEFYTVYKYNFSRVSSPSYLQITFSGCSNFI